MNTTDTAPTARPVGRPRRAVQALDVLADALDQIANVRAVSLDWVPPPGATLDDFAAFFARLGFTHEIRRSTLDALAAARCHVETTQLGARLGLKLERAADVFADLIRADAGPESAWLVPGLWRTAHCGGWLVAWCEDERPPLSPAWLRGITFHPERAIQVPGVARPGQILGASDLIAFTRESLTQQPWR